MAVYLQDAAITDNRGQKQQRWFLKRATSSLARQLSDNSSAKIPRQKS